MKPITAFDRSDLRALLDCQIVEIRGLSGQPTTLDVAASAPQLVRIHAMSGLVFDVTGYDAALERFDVQASPLQAAG